RCRRLPSSVGYLHPEMCAVLRSGTGIGAQRSDRLIRLRTVDCNIARAFEITPVDLHIARKQHACTPFGPALVETHMALRGAVKRIAESLGHGALGKAVLQR